MLAAAAIAADAGPCQPWPVSPVVTEEYDPAAAPNSDTRPSQAAAAPNNGAEPAPVYISKELISGANTAKFTMFATSSPLGGPLPP